MEGASSPTSPVQKRSKSRTPPKVIEVDEFPVVDDDDDAEPNAGNNNNDMEEEHSKDKNVTLKSVAKRLRETQTRLERMFGVSFTNYQNAANMKDGFFRVDWDREYAPARSIVDTTFVSLQGERKYGGMDLHKDVTNTDTDPKIKMVFKTPQSVDKVLCVPYYLLAEQVKANTLFLQNLNSRVLPGIDIALYELSVLAKAIRVKDAPATLRQAAGMVQQNPRISTFPFPPVIMPVTPATKKKNTGIKTEARKYEVKRQLEETQNAKAMDNALEYDAMQKKAGSSKDAIELMEKLNMQQQQQQQQQQMYMLPDGFEKLSVEDKLNRLMAAFYLLNTNTAANNVRLIAVEQALPQLRETLERVQLDVRQIQDAQFPHQLFDDFPNSFDLSL